MRVSDSLEATNLAARNLRGSRICEELSRLAKSPERAKEYLKTRQKKLNNARIYLGRAIELLRKENE